LGAYSAQGGFRNLAKPSIVSSVLRKVADGVYWIEGSDGLPVGLATTLDDGTPLKVAEQWWEASRSLAEWTSTPEAREWFARQGVPYPPGDPGNSNL
jgi:hypothetical protein